MGRWGVAAAVLLLAFILPVFGEDTGGIRFGFDGAYSMPVFGDEEFYNSGYRASLSLEYPLTPILAPVARAATSSFSLKGLDAISVLEGSIGVSGSFNFLERLFSRTELTAGLYRASWGTYANNGVVGNAQTEIGFRLSPALRISAETGFSRYLQASGDLYSGFSFGINFTIEPARFDPVSTNMKIEALNVTPVFPVFYSYYNDHSFGSVKLWNGEDSNIRNVKVSFYVPEYMTGPKECASFDSIGKGDTVTVPITALFNEQLLTLTEQTKSRGELLVEYSFLGSKRQYRQEIDLTINHRNAMNWSDDRRAAAFVSGKDPAVLWFSRFVNSVVRDRFRTGIDRNLQQAVGIFEAMDIFGISYVVDPTSAYTDAVGKDWVVDYLQFPHQTLFYRGGDCDDLSILFTSLLQSVGIQTAFITVPGHIYMAFATEMDQDSARKNFYDPNLLIFKDGKAWIPVEITMVKDGFVKAWRVGAKEYSDNALTGKANFYPMEDSWRLYPPANVSNINPRFLLPDEAVTMKTFDMELDRYVARQIEPLIRTLRLAEAASPNKETENQIGSLYARYGMLDQAWVFLSQAAQKGFLPAWINLANIAFIRKDFTLAKQYYQYVRDHDPFEPTAPLGLARCEYELENFDAATKAYNEVQTLDPAISSRYSYLVSIFGGEGRAWTLSDRANSVEWLDRIRTAPQGEPKLAQAQPAKTAEPSAAVPAQPKLREPSTPRITVESATKPNPPEKIAEASPPPPEKSSTIPETVSQKETLSNPPITARENTPPSSTQPAPKNAVSPEPTVPTAAVTPAPEIAVPAESAAPTPIATPAPASAQMAPLVAAPAPMAPVVESPRIALAAPKDADIAQKEADRAVTSAPEKAVLAESAAPTPVTTTMPASAQVAPLVATPAPMAPVVESPRIALAAPKDADIAQKEADRAASPALKPPSLTVLPGAVPPPMPESATSLATPPVAASASTEPVATAPEPAAPPESAAAPTVHPAEESVPAPIVAMAKPENVSIQESALPASEKRNESPGKDSAQIEQFILDEPPPFPASTGIPASTISKTDGATIFGFPPEPDLILPKAEPAQMPPGGTLKEKITETEPSITVAPQPSPEAPAPLASVPVAPSESEPLASEPSTSVPMEKELTAEPQPVGSAETAPTLVETKKEEPTTLELLKGFGTFKKGLGTWSIQDDQALQTDPKQRYAKIAAILPEGVDTIRFSFDARTTGNGWTGFGVHMLANKVRTLLGYGAGQSILVWFTSDNRSYPDAPNRIQIYLSIDDINMTKIADRPLQFSFDQKHSFTVEIDRLNGTISAKIDSIECLNSANQKYRLDGSMVIFRALDSVEFSNFRAESVLRSMEGRSNE